MDRGEHLCAQQVAGFWVISVEPGGKLTRTDAGFILLKLT
jgi:hypothetical protein